MVPEFSPALAADLVLRLRPVKDILDRYEMTQADLKRLLANPQFRTLCNEARQKWTSDLSAGDRVKLKAAIIAEDVLPTIHGMIVSGSTPAPARVDAFKTVNRLAQLDTPEKSGAESGRFVINIRLGGDSSERLVIDQTPRGGSQLEYSDAPEPVSNSDLG